MKSCSALVEKADRCHCMFGVDPEYEYGFLKYSVHDFIMILLRS